jgi:hypothetical protein
LFNTYLPISIILIAVSPDSKFRIQCSGNTQHPRQLPCIDRVTSEQYRSSVTIPPLPSKVSKSDSQQRLSPMENHSRKDQRPRKNSMVAAAKEIFSGTRPGYFHLPPLTLPTHCFPAPPVYPGLPEIIPCANRRIISQDETIKSARPETMVTTNRDSVGGLSSTPNHSHREPPQRRSRRRRYGDNKIPTQSIETESPIPTNVANLKEIRHDTRARSSLPKPPPRHTTHA